MFSTYFETVCEKRGLEFRKCAECNEFGGMALYVIKNVTTKSLVYDYGCICHEYICNDFFVSAVVTCFSFLGEQLIEDMELSELMNRFSWNVQKLVEKDFHDMIGLHGIYIDGPKGSGLDRRTIFIVGEKDYLKLMGHLDKLKADLIAEKML